MSTGCRLIRQRDDQVASDIGPGLQRLDFALCVFTLQQQPADNFQSTFDAVLHHVMSIDVARQSNHPLVFVT